MSTHSLSSALRNALAALTLTTAALTLLLAPSPASACDEELDPLVLQTARVTVELEAWAPEAAQLREWFQWMARTEKLLPPDYTLHASMWGELRLCHDDGDTCRNLVNSFDGYDLSAVYDATATALGTPKKGAAWLRARTFPTWTVQLASSPLSEGAHALADQLDSDLGHMRVGHTGVGVFSAERGNEIVYKVFAGVYTSRAHAQAALVDLDEEGHPGLVRPL